MTDGVLKERCMWLVYIVYGLWCIFPAFNSHNKCSTMITLVFNCKCISCKHKFVRFCTCISCIHLIKFSYMPIYCVDRQTSIIIIQYNCRVLIYFCNKNHLVLACYICFQPTICMICLKKQRSNLLIPF